MARPAKKVDPETVAWVIEYMVSRVNRASWKLQLSKNTKRNKGYANPKAEVYRLAASAIDLQNLFCFEDSQWLQSLGELIMRVNDWIDDNFDSAERARMWTAFRVAKKRGDLEEDALIFDHYEKLMEGKQQEFNV